MSDISIVFKGKSEWGTVSCAHKQDRKFYENCNLLHKGDGIRYGSVELCEKDHRYINWSDRNHLILSSCFRIPNLCRKMPSSSEWYRVQPGFDHTTFWRTEANKYPYLCLTEPYCLNEGDISYRDETFEQLKIYWKSLGYNLEYKIYEPSEKSLWYPNSTYMVFWWCPDYFDFFANEDSLMGHESHDDLKKRMKYDVRHKSEI